MKKLKNILNLKSVQNIQKNKLGLIFYANIIFSINKRASNINKITTSAYLSFLKSIDSSLVIKPKFPNFFISFDSINEIEKSVLSNSIFIKIKNIYCFSKNINLPFLMNEFVLLFFSSLLNLLRLGFLVSLFFLLPQKLEEFT